MRSFMGRHKRIYWKMSSITHLPKREYTEFHMEKFLEGLYMKEFLRDPVEKAKELMLINSYITIKYEPLNEWLDGKSEMGFGLVLDRRHLEDILSDKGL